MSLLEELSIQGIRSFGPEYPQRVTFSTPVTLILGPNGTGKTTIIECLKYAATGELPPGAKTGASFIHDPKLAHSVEVKAKVAMKIKDVRNCAVIVSRSLTATQKGTAKQASLKTLDGTIKRQLPDGEIVSLSSRCAEIDREMATSLGASKAVFENVIFCHQEESNWPLQEAKSVKERFDDLFASSRYVKALEAIRKTRMEQEGNAKICAAELKHLGRSKEEANQVRSQQIDVRQNLNAHEKRLSGLNEKLHPITDELTLYRQKYAELVEYQSDARSFQTEKNRLESALHVLTENITNEFAGTDDELKEAIEKAELQFAGKQQSLTLIDQGLVKKSRQLEENETNCSKLLIKKTQLEGELERLEETILKRNDVLCQLAANLGIPEFSNNIGNDGVISDKVMNDFKNKFQTAVKKADDSLKQTKVSSEKEERKAQTAVDDARAAVVRMEQSIAAHSRSLKENAREKLIVETKLIKASSASDELQFVKETLEKATEVRRCLQDANDIANAEKTIAELQTTRRKYEAENACLDTKISEVQRNAMNNHERTHLEKTRKTAIDNAKKIRSRHLDMLEQIFSGEPVPQIIFESELDKDTSMSLPRQFHARLNALVESAKTSQQQLTKLQQERTSLEASLSFQRKMLHEKQDILRQKEESLLSACGSTDLELHMDKLLTRKKQLESDYANGEGSLYLWKKFRDRLADNCECPLCHREFDSENDDRQDLQAEIDKRITSMPRDLDSKRKELQEVVTKYEVLIELKPASQELSFLIEQEVPRLTQKANDTTAELEILKEKVDQETEKLEFIQADQSIAQSLQGDIAVLEQLEKDIAKLNQSMNKFASTHDNAETKSLSELHIERDDLRKNCAETSKLIEEKRKQMDAYRSELQEAVNTENKLRDTLLKLEKDFQAVSNLSVELERLTTVNTRLVREIEEPQEQLPSFNMALKEAEDARKIVVEICEEHLTVAQIETQKWRDRERHVNEVCALVTNDGINRSRENFARTNQLLTELEAETEKVKFSIKSMADEIQELRSIIANHKIYQRELEDCVQVREMRSQLSLLDGRVKEILKKINECQSGTGISGTTDLVGHVNSLSVEEDRLRKQKQMVNDKITQLQTELRMLERSLIEKYADSEAEYIKKVYEMKTAQMAATDLQRYYHALDRAIMSYHASKMAEVNQIIRDLWRTTYRGNDIDFIEICSEEEPMSGSSAAVNSARIRRTYNYRVVMVKNAASSQVSGMGRAKQARISTEARLDMRGRCSAGQKVLASLVIRLALAEVFCIQCGVLALDEPTTNLDRENITSLAYALTEIIKTRSGQRNFQLIVITHDEDFIELLGRADCVGHLLRISRNLEGLSTIEKIRIEDQFN